MESVQSGSNSLEDGFKQAQHKTFVDENLQGKLLNDNEIGSLEERHLSKPLFHSEMNHHENQSSVGSY